MNQKEQRLNNANELIQLIATTGRKFFNHSDRPGCFIGYFVLNEGRTYFVDGYIKKPIYAYDHRYFGRKFTEGGTMQSLILDIAEWIRTGEPMNAKNGYGGVYCNHWGYPAEDMAKIQAKAVEIGFSVGLSKDLNRRDYIAVERKEMGE